MAAAKTKKHGTSFTNTERAARGRPQVYSFTLEPDVADEIADRAVERKISRSKVVSDAIKQTRRRQTVRT